mgnify:FL=1
MKFPLLFKSLREVKLVAFVFLGAGTVIACGPDFPNRYLTTSEAGMLAAPEGFFAVEIERLAPVVANRGHNSDDSQVDTRESDELYAALVRRGESEACAEKILRSYQAYRKLQRVSVKTQATVETRQFPGGLPLEFAHYLAGAQAWHENDVETARKEWSAVLALPQEERHYRSTWATYMLGRIEADNCTHESAQRWFGRMREMAKSGFADSTNLVGASFGIEARWALDRHDYAQAIDLYLDQYATGDESAYASLRMAAAATARSGDREKSAVAGDPRARAVLTAWFLARFSSGYEAESDPRSLCSWTAALVAAKVSDVDQADRLAWLAYEAADFELAKEWAQLALDSSAETHWIRAKLALRDNRLCDGARELGVAAVSPDLALIYRSTVLGELGRVQLALDHREAALSAWLEGAHWEDAAYVAERLLTIDELKMFMANYQPADLKSYEPDRGEVVTPGTFASGQLARADYWNKSGSSMRPKLSGLLARRLVRAGRIPEANEYFPEKEKALLALYAKDVREGFNSMLRPKKRAAAFWRAAKLMRAEGMTLMGTELDPDFGIWDGAFAYDESEDRVKGNAGAFSATKEERELLSGMPIPAKRFSYRYRAADLAWWAAALLPNGADGTATILNTAGGWLKARDPVEANRFYQALVIRCGRTALGKAAAGSHWFSSDR